MPYSLVLLNGPKPGAGIALEADGGPITIGRDVRSTLPIDDHLCSRLHARIWHDGQQWQLEDCGSRNGTYLNSQAIDRGVLQPGDLIRVGERLIVFARERGPGESDGWEPAKYGASTVVVRVTEPETRDVVVGDLEAGDGPRSMRRAALLCRLARELPQQDSKPALVKLLCDSLVAGTRADSVTIWLIGADGRLKHAGGSALGSAQPSDYHVLASLSVENNEALLVQHPGAQPVATMEETWDEISPEATRVLGVSLSVPLSGRSSRLGAIECHCHSAEGAFQRDDLELAIAIARHGGLALENLEYREQLEQANQQLRETVAKQTRIMGNSPAMGELLDKVARVAATHSTVLIQGESGTGKELVARLIHESSSRRAGPYVAVNCAAFNESLLESELFGHEKGAFTGADRRHVGQFERSHSGTIFLDEIGEMSPACQARLLRILEGHAFERVGGSDPIQIDIRIIAATHRNLPDLIQEGRFREDLYFRLRVIELSIPPLRERGDDVVMLAAHFLELYQRQIGRGPRRLARDVAGALAEYPWPGNVRELKNAIERAVVLGQGEDVLVSDLGLPEQGRHADGQGKLLSLAEMEHRHIAHVLSQLDGNKTHACKVLGIGRGTLYKKLSD